MLDFDIYCEGLLSAVLLEIDRPPAWLEDLLVDCPLPQCLDHHIRDDSLLDQLSLLGQKGL